MLEVIKIDLDFATNAVCISFSNGKKVYLTVEQLEALSRYASISYSERPDIMYCEMKNKP